MGLKVLDCKVESKAGPGVVNCHGKKRTAFYRSPFYQLSFHLRTAMPTLLLLLLLQSLASSAVKALFVQPPFKVKPYPELKLAIADRLGVPYKGIAYDAGKAASLPGFALSLNAEFGALNESTFDALLKNYCVWSETKSRVKWKEGRKYTLLDFLPPLLQAVSAVGPLKSTPGVHVPGAASQL